MFALNNMAHKKFRRGAARSGRRSQWLDLAGYAGTEFILIEYRRLLPVAGSDLCI